MYSIELRIPKQNWTGFRKTILTKMFVGEPTLTRHRLMADASFEYACFCSEYDADILTAVGIIGEFDGECCSLVSAPYNILVAVGTTDGFDVECCSMVSPPKNRYEVRDMSADSCIDLFDTMYGAKAQVKKLVDCDIKDCTGSFYAIIDRMTGEMVYCVESDNTDSFTIDDMRTRIISLLNEEIKKINRPGYAGIPNPVTLRYISELSDICASKLRT